MPPNDPAAIPQSDPAPGIYPGLAYDDYRALPGLSHSRAKRVLRGGGDPWQGGSHAGHQDWFGQRAHALMLEPERFHAEHKPAPPGLKQRKDEGRRRWEEMERQMGATLVRRNEWDSLAALERTLRVHPEASALLARGVAEASVFWVDPGTGIALKGRPDWVDEVGGVVVDLKFTLQPDELASDEGLERRGLDFQAAWYLAGFRAVFRREARFYFVVADRRGPHSIRVVAPGPAVLESGAEKVRRVLAACLENGWERRPDGCPI